MSKPNRKRFRLAEIRQTHAEKNGGDEILIEAPDGGEFTIPAPGFWPDEATALLGQNRDVALATILLGGPERYTQYKNAGGRAQDVALILAAHAEDQGVTEGESGASSDS